MRKPKGAKSLKGVKGNLKFVLGYKAWAAVVIFAAGAVVGAALAAVLTA